MQEKWQWVAGYKGLYQISNMGRMKSFKKSEEGFVLSNTNAQGGYFSVVLTNGMEKKKRYVRIHVLVAQDTISLNDQERYSNIR